MSTEARNPRSIGLDRLDARSIVRLMNEEEQAVMLALRSAEEDLAIAAEAAAGAFAGGGRVIYVGAGTSGRIATADAAEMPPTFGVEPDRFISIVAGGKSATDMAVEGEEDSSHGAIAALNRIEVAPPDVLFGIAASGRTPFTISAVKHAGQKGMWTCAIVNNRETPLAEAAAHAVVLETGPEVLTGSTRLKAGTAQKLALNRISTAAMVLCGKVIENLMVDVRASNSKLKSRSVQIVRDLTELTEEEAETRLEQHDWDIRAVLHELNVLPA